MRHGALHLDLTTEEFLTDPEIAPNKSGHLEAAHLAAINSGDHIIRDGNADSHWSKGGGHNGGRPYRIARDLVTGKMFVRIADVLPSDLVSDKLVKQKDDIEKRKPFHVPGSGFWLPLEELFPDHPHADEAVFGGDGTPPVLDPPPIPPVVFPPDGVLDPGP